MIVHFVDIGGIDDHRCLNFLFIMLSIAGMEINSRPGRVKFQLGDQILLCSRPVGE